MIQSYVYILKINENFFVEITSKLSKHNYFFYYKRLNRERKHIISTERY